MEHRVLMFLDKLRPLIGFKFEVLQCIEKEILNSKKTIECLEFYSISLDLLINICNEYFFDKCTERFDNSIKLLSNLC